MDAQCAVAGEAAGPRLTSFDSGCVRRAGKEGWSHGSAPTDDQVQRYYSYAAFISSRCIAHHDEAGREREEADGQFRGSVDADRASRG